MEGVSPLKVVGTFFVRGSWNVFLYVVVGTFFCTWMEGFSYVDGRVFLRGWKRFSLRGGMVFVLEWTYFRTGLEGLFVYSCEL